MGDTLEIFDKEFTNVNVFGLSNGVTLDRVFYVPYSADHLILNVYKTATNWSAYALLI